MSSPNPRLFSEMKDIGRSLSVCMNEFCKKVVSYEARRKFQFTDHFLVSSMNCNMCKVWLGGKVFYFFFSICFLMKAEYDRDKRQAEGDSPCCRERNSVDLLVVKIL